MSSTTAPSGSPAFTRASPGWRARLESTPLHRLGNCTLALSLVAIGVVLRAVNLTAAPARTTGEGALLLRADALDGTGSLDRLTDWYDHPPLGWLVLGLWTSATSMLEDAPSAIASGRSLAVTAAAVTAGLLWILARRLGFERSAAGLAVLLFGLSPLAVHLHRVVSPDNLAIPWVVAAFVLAASPRRPLVAFAGSGACLAVAVLTSETMLVFLPLLVWQLRRSSLPSTRRYGFVIGGSLFLSICAGYFVNAQIRGQLTASDDHAGLLDGLHYRLLDRPPTSSFLDTGAGGTEPWSLWFDLDPVGLVAMLVAAVVALRVTPSLRPFAAAVLVVAGWGAVPGITTPTWIVGALPFGALAVAGVVQHLQQTWSTSRQAGAVRRLLAVGAVAVVVVTAVAAGVDWAGEHRRLLGDDSDAPAQAAERWMVDNVPPARSLIVDDSLWPALAEAGIDPERMASYTALDIDRRVGLRAPGQWSDYDVVVATPTLRDAERYPAAAAALERSLVVAAFGTGSERIEIRRIVPTDADADADIGARANPHDPAAAAGAGAALASNPRLEFTAAAEAALVAGEVDVRLMTTLVALATSAPGELRVEGFPADPAETTVSAPRRRVELHAATDDAGRAVADLLQAQSPPYRPLAVNVDGDGLVSVTYPPAALL